MRRTKTLTTSTTCKSIKAVGPYHAYVERRTSQEVRGQPLGIGIVPHPLETRPFYMWYHAKSGHSKSNSLGTSTGPKIFGNAEATAFWDGDVPDHIEMPLPHVLQRQIWSLQLKPKKFGSTGVPVSWDRGHDWPSKNTPLPQMCYHAEFGHSRSNGFMVCK